MPSRPRTHEAGFTLVEAMTAIVILVFGLVAVTNLLIVAGNSSQVANAGSTAAALAQEQMEILRSTPFVLPAGAPAGSPVLVPGPGGANPLDTDTPGYFRVFTVAPSAPNLSGLVNAADNTRLRVPGSGTIRVRWSIVQVSPQLYHITVRSEAIGTLLATRSRAEYTTFRACVDPVANAGICPAGTDPCC